MRLLYTAFADDTANKLFKMQLLKDTTRIANCNLTTLDCVSVCAVGNLRKLSLKFKLFMEVVEDIRYNDRKIDNLERRYVSLILNECVLAYIRLWFCKKLCKIDNQIIL